MQPCGAEKTWTCFSFCRVPGQGSVLSPFVDQIPNLQSNQRITFAKFNDVAFNRVLDSLARFLLENFQRPL